MDRGLPDNLKRLYSALGNSESDPLVGLLSGDSFTVDDVEFVCDYQPGSTADRFFIVKGMEHVRQYRDLLDDLAPEAIFELGIAEGGSTALTALVAEPRKLVAIDNETQPLRALEDFVARHGLTEVVRSYWDTSQGDADRLREIVHAEFAGDPLDLVIDDASHQLALTRSSFDTLFPFLRPGGLYVIEDWNHDHVWYDGIVASLRDPSAPEHEERVREMREAMASGPSRPPPQPLSELAVDLLLARASSGDAIAEVTFGEYSMVARRGPGELRSGEFRVRDLYTDHFGLAPGASGRR